MAEYEPTPEEIARLTKEILRARPREPEPSEPGFAPRIEPLVYRAADVLPGVYLPPPSVCDIGSTFGSFD